MKTEIFLSSGHCWVFQICGHIECITLTTSSFRIWNSSAGIPSPPLVLLRVMLPNWRRKWKPTPVILPGEFHGQKSLAGMSMGLQESDSTLQLNKQQSMLPFLKTLIIYFNWRLISLQYCDGFCHTLTWISHGCTCVPHPEPPSHLPPHPIPQGHPSAPALSALSHALNLDWQSVSHMIMPT